MGLSEQEYIDKYLSKAEKEELEEMVNKMAAVYLYSEQIKGSSEWKHDSERFLGFTFSHTRDLVRHSIALNKLTARLVWLTRVLAVLTLVNVVILIVEIIN
jgi:hypothetical protein